MPQIKGILKSIRGLAVIPLLHKDVASHIIDRGLTVVELQGLVDIPGGKSILAELVGSASAIDPIFRPALVQPELPPGPH